MSKKFKGFRPRLNITSFTPIPNEFFDEVLPNIQSLAELKILLAVFRKTYGWVERIDPESGEPIYKQQDSISMSQFKKLTGLSQPSCVDGVRRALDDGYLERVREGSFQGGDPSENVSAEYRIVQCVTPLTPTTPPDGGQDKGIEKEQDKKIEDVSPAEDMSFTDNSDSEKVDPQSLLEEFFPPRRTDEPAPPKKKERKTFKNKPKDQWNANDLLAYFNSKYREVLGHGAGPITAKLRTLAKKLLEGYETEDLVKAIDYYLTNYKNIHYLPTGYPSFNVFFGYRQSLIPEALDPHKRKWAGGVTKKKNMAVREFIETDDDDDDDGVEYVWT